ncbi:hypothetical protein V2J09_007738 [Rumex salicifolius]
MGMNLFDGSDDDVDDISKIEVNNEFAKRYEHNKKREDLHRLEELKKKGLVADSGSDSESDSDSWNEDAVNSTKDDIQLFSALLKIRSKDPALKEKDVKLFDSSSESEDEGEGKGKSENGKKREKKGKKKYLKDVNAAQLMEMGPEFVGSEEEYEEDEKDSKKVKTYSEEQEELRKSLLDEIEKAEREVGEEGDLLRVKSKEAEEDEDGEEDEEINEKVDTYFGDDEKLDQESLFLKEFFKKKMWIDKEEGKTPEIDEDIELSDDEEAIERQEEYEREFNFRFEEASGDRVQSHSRVVGDSVRKKENVRKEQRKRKKERMEQAELERQEEVKRLKNLKKKEIMEKINRVKLVAGLDDGVDIPLTEADLEEDFDPEKYDKKMKKAFGEQYYDAEDVNSDFGSDLEKPDFENEDKLLGLPEDWDVCNPGEGFRSERQKYLQTLEEHEGEADDKEEFENGIEEDDEEPSESKRKRKRKMSLKEKISLDEDLEELYKLDYEDTIGDLKTRFKYKKVASKRYGLSACELLALDEEELNAVVSIKKLAPYREKEWKVPHPKLMALKKKKEHEIPEKRHVKDDGNKHKKRKTDERAMEAGEEQEQRTDDSVAMSRKEKRKRRKAEINISESRLMAYGKIPSKSKGCPSMNELMAEKVHP